MTVNSVGKITKQFLKTISGEFEVESIHNINLQNLDINDLGSISDCTNLEQLDLSKNNLSKLHKLAGLDHLAVLNLSANRIHCLEGLQSLEGLCKLNLSGNLIGSIGELGCLTGLSNLKELRLEDYRTGLSNPLCHNTNYKQDVINLFPTLVSLNGERVSGKGSELFLMCQQIDKAIEESTNKAISNNNSILPTPWVDDNYWTLDTSSFDNSNLHDAEQQLEDLLKSCKKLSEDAAHKLQEAMLTS
ncbi:hypothetical protein LOTGIDRAFT_233089 [Lottia gigantea]|uniref:Leucine-rich repeat-containing protein 61 n=1 Tax=Lottia gigantea TaxID=225164 RepID=V3ZMQ6_LOTGI|nr:hypothetical protein LOTGIDRAFT_233089 [Lottia gigantea]ESO92658.1 hypothetical protein LOTGIDRAFT_233089 [Lottia gigantea]